MLLARPSPSPFEWMIGLYNRQNRKKENRNVADTSPRRCYALRCFARCLSNQAQQPPASNPLDVVPEKMPFNVPYGAPITLATRRGAIARGHRRGQETRLEDERCRR